MFKEKAGYYYQLGGIYLRKLLVLTVTCILILTASAMAAPEPPAIDSTPDKAVLINFDEWLAANPVKFGDPAKMVPIFKSPRNMVAFINANTFKLPKHYHTSADEILVILKGEGEMVINGEWTKVKAGDVHINPRGAVHAVRCADGAEFSAISIFTPPQVNGNDRVAVD